MSKKLIEELKKTFEPEIEDLGYELVDLEFVHEEGDNFLRFYIYNNPITTVEDCERCSTYLSERLDELDPISSSYFLEVSTPDLNRPLVNDKDLNRNIGVILDLSLYKKIMNTKLLRGKLLDFDDESLLIEVDGEKIKVERQYISKIMVAIIF